MAKVGWSAGIPQLQPHLPASEDRAFDPSDGQRALHASAFLGSQSSRQGSYGGPLQGRCRSGSVHRSEGSGRWQKDHECLSLVARDRHVRCSAPARLIVPPRKVNLPIRVPPYTWGSAFFCPFSCICRKKAVIL